MIEYIKKHIRETIIIVVACSAMIDIVFGFCFINKIIYEKKAKEAGYYYIDKEGKLVNSKSFKDPGTPFNEDGLAYVTELEYRYGLKDKGFMNEKGEFLGRNLDGRAELNGQFGFPLLLSTGMGYKVIDKDMNVLAEREWDYTDLMWSMYSSDFSRGLVLATKENLNTGYFRCGYINEKLEFVIEPQYIAASPFSEDGIAAVKEPESDKWGLIDTKGTYISEERYHAIRPFDGGYALVQKEQGGNGAYINTKGEYITDFVFDFNESQSGFSEGLAYVKYADKGGYGYINENGKDVIEPWYREAGEFSHGLAPVKDSNYKYIDKEGNVVIEGDYSWIGAFTKDGYAAVEQDGKYGIIDTNGEWLFEPQFSVDTYYDWQEDDIILKNYRFNVKAPEFINGHCIVFLEKGQRVKKAKNK